MKFVNQDTLVNVTRQFGIAIFVLFCLNACEDTVLDLEPDGQIVQENLFQDASGAIAAVNAAYERLCLLSSGEQSMLHRVEEKSDNAFHTRTNFEYQRFEELPATTGIDETWRTLFGCIQRSNLVIGNVQEVPFTPAQVNSKLGPVIKGQAHFLRALSYFWLVQLYGDVPIYSEPLAGPDDVIKPRDSMTDVYAFIKSDLDSAIKNLPLKTAYNNSVAGFERFRASQGSAFALKAEVHLVLEEWQEAFDAANAVITSGVYGLYPTADYIRNFQGRDENGLESVFEIQFTDNPLARGSFSNTWFGLPNLVQGNGLRGSASTDDETDLVWPGAKGSALLQAFEPNDIRKEVAVSNYGNAPNPIDRTKTSLWMCNKYFVGTATPTGARSYANFPVIRFAKTILTAAESLNELDRSAEASVLVAEIRSRAGLGVLDSEIVADKNLFRAAIWKERRLELCYEAQRYFDLLRTGQLIPIVEGVRNIPIDRSRIVPSLSGKDAYLWPIPQTERDNNPLIEQNPGY